MLLKELLFLSAGSLIHVFNRSQVRVKQLVSGEYRNQFVSSVGSALSSKVVVAPTVHEVRMCDNGKTYILIMPKMHYKIILITIVIVIKL